jgi:radical SAM protein with 4Fe4S-binding SPASM domain
MMTRKKDTMSMELYKKIVDDAAQIGIKELGLSNYGEPLLDKFLFERIEYAKSKGMQVGLTDNGTLLGRNDNVVRLLNSNPDWIEISIDGVTKQTYEKIRVGAKFEDLVDGFTKLVTERGKKNGNPAIYISCVVQAENYDEIRSNKKRINKIFEGADYIGFNPMDTRVGDKDKSLPSGIDFRTPAKRIKYNYPCRRPFNTIIVLVDGSVALCCLDYDGKVRLGDLNVQSIKEVWNTERYKKIRSLQLEGSGRQIEICKNCNSLRSANFVWWK